jgi:hypothetical protein
MIWVAVIGRSVMAPNFTFDRTEGSHALAAAGQRGRYKGMARE